VEEPSPLEDYIRTAEVDLHGHFDAQQGGGHPSKQLVLLRGGIGALAKLATTDEEARQSRSEVGAYVLAHLLGWDDLVPVTVFREVPTPSGVAPASVQILWPAFRTAQELGIIESSIPEAEATRCAIFDGLLLNSDRNAGNWGLVAMTRLALIDNGRTVLSDFPGVSGFANARRGQQLGDADEAPLEMLGRVDPDRLNEAVGEAATSIIVQRAQQMLESGTVLVDPSVT